MSETTLDAILAGLAHAHETKNEQAFFDLFRQGSDISQTPEDWRRFRDTLRHLGLGEAAAPDGRQEWTPDPPVSDPPVSDPPVSDPPVSDPSHIESVDSQRVG